jgi:hypothetical protein
MLGWSIENASVMHDSLHLLFHAWQSSCLTVRFVCLLFVSRPPAQVDPSPVDPSTFRQARLSRPSLSRWGQRLRSKMSQGLKCPLPGSTAAVVPRRCRHQNRALAEAIGQLILPIASSDPSARDRPMSRPNILPIGGTLHSDCADA